MVSPQALYDKESDIRLKALVDLIEENPKRIKKGWINLHVHTNESFSVFNSPAEAVWHAYMEDVEYFGINDHYTTDGYREFEQACMLAHLKPVLSVEAIAMDVDSHRRNSRFNDPDNPGRIYVVGKGVTQTLQKRGRGYKILDRMKEAVQRRNRSMVEELNRYAHTRGYNITFSYQDVLALTPRGNATERHVVQAFCEKINDITERPDERREIFSNLMEIETDERLVEDSAELQSFVRLKLLKSGRPCYVEEDGEAFTTVENLVDIFLEYGAIPTYPLLGSPLTEEERDLEKLIEKALKNRMYAFDLFDFRTETKRAEEIIEAAMHYGFPVFIGTEHNTKKMLPMVGDIGKNRAFYPYFRESAQFVCGHQLLSKLCDFGYVTQEGRPRIAHLKEGFQFFVHVGSMDLQKEEIDELKKRDIKERKKFFGIDRFLS